MMKCAVCMEYMLSRIRMGVNGYNICDNCRPKLDDCPTCSKRFLSTGNLDPGKLAQEVKFSCSHRQFGCAKGFAHDKLDEYQIKCPAAIHNFVMEPCDWIGNYKEVKNHLIENHIVLCSYYGELESGNLHDYSHIWWFQKFVFVYGEVFFRMFVVRDGTFHVAVQYIGPPDKASEYMYKVTFFNENNTEGVELMHLTRYFDKIREDIFKPGNCEKLDGRVMSRLESQKGDLKYKLQIFRVG